MSTYLSLPQRHTFSDWPKIYSNTKNNVGNNIHCPSRSRFRSNWVVSNSGDYSAVIKSPTGIPSDPALAAHGVDQAHELAAHVSNLDPKPKKFFSSPYYRCLQTIEPVVKKLGVGIDGVEGGIAEWFGVAPFDHPSPAKPEVLKTFFSFLNTEWEQIVTTAVRGETKKALHDRTAFALTRLIERMDALGDQCPRAIMLCAHAAPNIAMGRVLVGDEDYDIKVGTCSLSTFHRKQPYEPTTSTSDYPSETFDINRNAIPVLPWRDGKGVGGGWECVVNGDCSFLSQGEERNWWFGGDEAWDFPIEKGTGVTKTMEDVEKEQKGGAVGKDEKEKKREEAKI